ncbi:CNH domain-containing protein [Mycena belliarum]|uniref:CNH domain-containing protein n=1 Tax=Mycena belliarum TaxID=1033014 RepID=A0AAD6UAU9_9AGAR|nr:CNH domain-containing protein [Mycena belliae]
MDRSRLFDFASLAALKHTRPRLPTRATSVPNFYTPESPHVPSPPPLSNQPLPIEIVERIIDFLHADKTALIASSTVCRSWFPTSRYHLYTLLPVIPVAVGESCRKVNTAVALADDGILYGTNNGLYLSCNHKLLRVLKLPAVSQIDVLPTHDLLLVLSGRRLLVGPLHLATGADPALLYRRLVVLSTDASFFQAAEHGGKRVVCVVHTGRFSSHFKLLEAVQLPAGASAFKPYRSFYLPDHAHSVHIWNKTIGAALRRGFQCVDPVSLVTFPVPVGPAPPLPEGAPPRKPRALFRVDERFLVCYDRCAFFMDKAGASSEHAFALRWVDAAKQFALHYPYLLAFSAVGMHAWRVDRGVCVQTVLARGGGIRLLASAPRILVRLGDGRVLALGCAAEG